MEIKTCSKCKNEFPLTEEYFVKTKGYKDGFHSYCKRCKKKYSKQWYKKNIDYVKECNKQWNIDNPQKARERKKHWSELNEKNYPGFLKEYRKRWGKENKNKVNGYKQKRRTIKKGLLATLTIEEWINIKNHFNNECCYCGKKSQLFQDHFIPLSKGGEYIYNNIIPACGSCNSSKNNKNFLEWYPEYKYYSETRKNKILEFTKDI